MKAVSVLRVLVLCCVLGVAASSDFFAQEASVTAEVSPNPVGVDEQVSLTIMWSAVVRSVHRFQKSMA